MLASLLFFYIAINNTTAANTLKKIKSGIVEINPQELGTFLDNIFSKYMSELHVPGATFVIVKDGEILFSKGYGFAKIKEKIPVDPSKTIFRAASISKLFTATAVMQLSEQGKIKLNENVNTYLSNFKIKNTYPKPITVANLLTHTAGFDYEIIGMAEIDKKNVKSLRKYLSGNMPKCIYPPGYVINYSNYGYTLAGYIVEQITGMPFVDYIERHILKPLGMKNSGFSQIPKTLDNLAQGYVFKNDRFQKMPFEYYNTLPASAFYTTAYDMANFMISQLQEGRFRNTAILKAVTAKAMHKRQFSHHPDLPGYGYGFCEYYFGKQRFLIHEGEVAGFKSLLVLNPENNFGFFISINCEPTFGKGAALLYHLKIQLLSRLYQNNENHTPNQNFNCFKSEIKRLAGNYRFARYSHNTFTKVDMLLADVHVGVSDGGDLLINSQKYIEIFPMVFQSTSNNVNWRVTFQKVEKTFFMFIGHRAFEKLKWYETKNIHLGIIIFCLIVFIASPLIWLIQAFNCNNRKQSALSKMIVKGRWIASIMSILNICLLIILAIFKSQFIGIVILWQIPVTLKVSFFIGICSFILAILVMVHTWIIFRKKIGMINKIHYSLVAIAGACFIWLLNYWNLLGFRF